MFDHDGLKPEQVRELAREYLETKNPKTLKTICNVFDRLLVKYVTDIQRRRRDYRDEDPQELYHIALQGFMKALPKIATDEDPTKQPARILSYVKAEWRHAFHYRTYEKPGLIVADQPSVSEKPERVGKDLSRALDGLDAMTLLNHPSIPERDRYIITQLVLLERDQEDLAKEMGMTSRNLRYRMRYTLNKLRKLGEKIL